jgi:hypothetical protein
MSEEGDTFWVSLAEKFFGLIVVVMGAILLYFTATSTGPDGLGGFSVFFGVVSFILLGIGLFLLLVRPPK